MTVRLSQLQDMEEIMHAFDHARRFMQENGNPNQWINGYPSAELMKREIEEAHCYVCENEKGEITGTFCFIAGEDPNYARIENGAWPNDAPYCTIHRMATNGRQKGVADACLQWCFEQCDNLRADTHQDNAVMQHLLEKHGFRKCGIIYVQNGTPRIAYQRTVAAASSSK